MPLPSKEFLVSEPLKAISPLDGRYFKSTESLSDYFSEHSLIRYRTKVEIEYLISLSLENGIPELKPFSKKDQQKLRRIYNSFNIDDSKRVKAIEEATNHDVKAVEYFIREKLEKLNKESLEPIINHLIKSNGTNFKGVGQPLRIVLTGSKFGPGIYDIIHSLGKDEVLKRLSYN